MPFFYFFQNDGRCGFIKKQFEEDYWEYLKKDKKYHNTEYYLNLEWNSRGGKGVETGWFDRYNYRYIRNISELPAGAGILVSGYDGSLEEIEAAKEKGTPVLEKICPWIAMLKNEIKKVRPGYQCLMLLDEGHMIFYNYSSIFPVNTVFLTIENYKEKLRFFDGGKPVHLLVYSSFRLKDAETIVKYISTCFPHKENIFWLKGICGWVLGSGIFEEIAQAVRGKNLSEIWVICSGENNRSVKSLVYEIEENGARPVIIKDAGDIPDKKEGSGNIGILRAPIPYSKEDEILRAIKERYFIDNEELKTGRNI